VVGWRRWLGLALIAVLAAGAIGYRWLTDETRLRRAAEAWLKHFTGAEARIEHISFRPTEGLQLTGVTLSVPEAAGFGERDEPARARTVFRTAALSVRIQPFSIISGDLVVPEIVAVDPELTLVRRTSDGVGNWAAMFDRRKQAKSWKPPSRLPVIRLRNAKLVQLDLGEGGLTGGTPQYMYIEARPIPGRASSYQVDVAKGVEPPAPQDAEDGSGELQIDLDPFTVVGSRLPTMSTEDLLFAAPPEIRKWARLLSLGGNVRLQTLSYGPRTRSGAILSLRDASFSIPLDSDDRELQPQQRYARFSKTAGTIQLDGLRATVALNGSFQGSTVELKGVLTLPNDASKGVSAMGFDLVLKLSDVSLPRNDPNADPSEVRFVQRWKRLAVFVEDYDGLGKVGLQVRVRKPAGTERGVELVDATLTLRGPSARYFRFPYRLYDLTGEVYFRPDGWIELKNLSGIHGLGRVVISGLVGGYVSKAAKLEIKAQGVELDDDLLHCLSEQDQALCRRFAAKARMDLHIQLERPDFNPDGPQASWKSVIDVTFAAGSLSFAGFPYPLGQLAGHMRIVDGAFQIDELRASAGGAKVSVRGTASRPEGGRTAVDLTLKATGIPLDGVLEAALPPDARSRYATFKPSGNVDVSGRLLTSENHDDVEYDLIATLSGAGLNVPGSAARLNHVGATLRISPAVLQVEALHGAFGTSPVELQARMSTTGTDSGMSLHLSSTGLVLDEALRACLPPSAQSVWDSFQPKGTVGLDVRYRSGALSSRPAQSAPAEPDYTIRIEPQACRATFAQFPLPMSEIDGVVEITPGKVAISQVTARNGPAEVMLRGSLTLDGHEVTGVLSGSVEDLKLSEAVKQALPWRLQRLWNEVQPTGTAGLSIEELAFTFSEGKPAEWRFAGRADLEGVGLSAGARLTGVDGEIIVHGAFGPTLSLAGGLALERVWVDGRLMTDVTALISQQPNDPVLRISDFVGQFCGGTLVGQTELDYSQATPRFGLSLSTRDVSLERFLNAKREPDEKPVQLKGRVEANLTLAGQIGDRNSRQGGGSIVIREAQMLKVPVMLAIMQVIHLAVADDNAFQDGVFSFLVDGDEVVLTEIDLRGKAFSMVGAGRVKISTEGMDLVLLVGSPFRLPRITVLSDMLEGVARELMEVHVEGTLENPTYRAELVRSVKATLDRILNMRAAPGR
jgi:hypothetical protein